MVGSRRNLLNYLGKKDVQRYRDIVEKIRIKKIKNNRTFLTLSKSVHFF